jgi:hypothetical protein
MHVNILNLDGLSDHDIVRMGLNPRTRSSARRENEAFVRSGNRFTDKEVRRLRCFGVREPRLTRALEQFGLLLETEASPRMEAAFSRAVAEFPNCSSVADRPPAAGARISRWPPRARLRVDASPAYVQPRSGYKRLGSYREARVTLISRAGGSST